jgi:peptidoglycan pentaglycine glycine transferase (the first glycine)
VRQVTDGAEWNALLSRLPQAHGMQCWEWGELRQQGGWLSRWVTRRLVFERDGKVVAAAAVQRRGLPAPGWGISYCPKGPILDYADGELARAVLEALAEDARRQRSIVLTVEPEAEAGTAGMGHALRQAGYRPSPAQLQSSSTVLVDLRADDEQLMKPMSATWRRYIRKAARDGVTVRSGTADDLRRFHEIYLVTAERDHFIPRPLPYLERLWRQLASAGLVELFLAEVDGRVEAGVLPFRFGRRAWYLYGGTTDLALERHAMYLLQWHTMRWARDHGCEVYDMWGAPDDPADKDDPLAGVYYFKRGFGGRHVRWVGPYDYVTTPALYRFWNATRPRLLGALRRLRRG